MMTTVFVPDLLIRGFAMYCDLGASEGWQDALTFLTKAGLSVEIPSHPTHVITVTDIGQRTDIPSNEFFHISSSSDLLRFKAWTLRGEDMLCEFTRVDALQFETYWFSHLEDGQAEFVQALVDRFEQQAAHSRIILIVDWAPISEGYDWPSFCSGRVEYKGVPPEILAVPKDFEHRLHLHGVDTEEFVLREHCDHVVISRVNPPRA